MFVIWLYKVIMKEYINCDEIYSVIAYIFSGISRKLAI